MLAEELVSAVYRGDVDSIAAADCGLSEVDEDGRSLLMLAVLSEKPSVPIIMLLLERGLEPNLHDKEQQWTALHFAARDQKLSVVELLLQHGAIVDEPDALGNSALWRAVMSCRDDPGVVRLLLRHGANARLKNAKGVCPLDVAQRKGRSNLVCLLEADATEQ